MPPDTDLQSVRRKLVLDQEYIHTAGLLLDVRIVFCTALRVLGLRGGRAVSLLGLSRIVELPPPSDIVRSAPPIAAESAPPPERPSLPRTSPVPLAAARS